MNSAAYWNRFSMLLIVVVLVSVTFLGCASGPLSTREKGAGIGALGGAVVGGLIGAAVGHPGAGAAIGGGLGLGAGALIGDQLQGQEQRQVHQQQQMEKNQAELERRRSLFSSPFVLWRALYHYATQWPSGCRLQDKPPDGQGLDDQDLF